MADFAGTRESRSANGEDCNDSKATLGRKLLDLPPELLLKIFGFVPTKDAIQRVCRVCKLFHSLFFAEKRWELRYRSYNRSKISEEEAEVDWKKACLHREEAFPWFRKIDHDINIFKLGGHFASLDCVHLLPDVKRCISGARDRTALIWDISELTHDETSTGCSPVGTLNGHKGWVWCLGSDPVNSEIVFSGSWDHTVRVWNLEKDTSEVIQGHPAAVLCMSTPEPNILYTGCFDKHTRCFDLRGPDASFTSKRLKRAVVCLEVKDNHVVAGCEDCRVTIWDKRSPEQHKSIKCPSMPICLHYSDNLLRVGALDGNLYSYRASADELTQLGMVTTGHSMKVTGLYHDFGLMMTSSTDGSVVVHEPWGESNVSTIVQLAGSQITRLDYAKGVLALAVSDGFVRIVDPHYSVNF
eukprot:m.17759 g.17759  ORF g.17759 m.17759 type:complete len:412 (+) comp27550_c0_seq1:49-1284(+)